MKSTAPRHSSIFQVLKEHFRNFTGPKTVELPISAYGKLPIYKDFLRHGLAGAEAQALKKWLDRGMTKYWAANAAYRDCEIAPHAFLFGFPATGRQLLGYLWGSHDHGGLRRFPFVLFVSVPTPRASTTLTLLHALGQWATQAARLRERIATLQDAEAFYPMIRTLSTNLTLHSELEIRESFDEAEESTRVGELGDSLYPQDAETQWPAFLSYLQRVRSGNVSFSAARLPASRAMTTVRLTILWSLLLDKARNPRKTAFQAFFAPGEPASGITILHRDLRSDDVFGFHPEMPEYEYILDLRTEVPGASATPSQVAEQLRDRPVSALLNGDLLTQDPRAS